VDSLRIDVERIIAINFHESTERTRIVSTIPTVAIVGRVNVGKSTLFNRIAGGRIAIVDDTPGVTRDRNIAIAEWTGHDFFIMDTGGLAPDSEDAFQDGIDRQVRLALEEADAVILVVDAMDGMHPFDIDAAEIVRKSGIPTFLAVNKSDNLQRMNLAAEFYRLGLGEPWPVSALHGHGTGDLLDALVDVLPREEHSEDGSLGLSVVGRPNVGKSSLVNRLCMEERNIVTDVAGTTRDSIDTLVEWKDNRIRLVDTAGLRRKSKKMDDVEFYSTVRAWKAISRGDVVLVIMDSEEYPVQQDIRIVAKAWEMGKGVIIGVNKIDTSPVDRELWIKSIIQRFAPARWIPIMFFSALTGEGVGRIIPKAVELNTVRNDRVPTPLLNKVIRAAVEKVNPPSPRGKQVRLLYATQVATGPPRIVIFVNHPSDLPENYRRYMEASIRGSIDLIGVPLRIMYRKREH